MKIINRIYNDWNNKQIATLKSQGFTVKKGYDSIDIEENELNKKILTIIDEWGLEKFFWTDYFKEDYLHSSFFAYVSTWINGYPMPDLNGKYLDISYNIDKYCEVCGVGKNQKAPFRIKSEPKWGSKSLFELNWVYDEIFVRKDIYEILFKNKGLKCREVLLYKKESIIENTVQLIVPVIDISLDMSDHPFELCSKCNRKKYSPATKGFFPQFVKKPPEGLEIFKSRESFGYGTESFNRIFISKNIWEEFKKIKINPNIWPLRP